MSTTSKPVHPSTKAAVKSWAAQVVADASGEYVGNGLRFSTRAAAEDYARDLESRWTLVRAWRVVEVDGAPTP